LEKKFAEPTKCKKEGAMGKILVFGGAGFVGSNLVHSLLKDGSSVTVFDSLARRGSEKNIAWLQELHPELEFIKGDIRDASAVKSAARHADVIYHLAAQVAVTTSVDDPRHDFDVNALGTFNVLEAARLSGRRPAVVFTSTNKVYGGLEDLEIKQSDTRYEFGNLPFGVSESRELDFHSPYGCSKGAADQYVRDYSRIYDLPTVVFRMSCIYGPRQFGNEDQGWVAHFIISTQTGNPLFIYGDGKQVRDVLFVEDLVRAFKLAVQKIDVTKGQIFNIGGGPENSLSVWSEFGKALGRLNDGEIPVQFGDWRPGDQPCYISDIRKADRVMGWRPQVSKEEGIQRLWDWVASNLGLFALPPVNVAPEAMETAELA
jgi:CDP-paratose 2-epimerase